MTRHLSPDVASDDFDRLLAAWIKADAVSREPDGLLEATLMRTGRMRRRPAWLLPERWIPMQLTMRLQPIPRIAAVLVILGLIVALAAVVVMIGSRPAVLEPFGLAGNGRIAFVSRRHLHRQPRRHGRGGYCQRVWTSTDDQSGPTSDRRSRSSRWSSTSATTADLMVLDVATGRVVRITNGAVQLSVPSWSPDDQMPTFSQDGPNGPAVYTARSDGSVPPTRLDALGVAEAPVWSPDGVRIAYVVPSGFAYELYVADADGTDARPLTGTYGGWPTGSHMAR